MSVKFKNPPINELVIGIYFDREINSLHSEHVGLFWGEVRKDFPAISHHTLLLPPLPVRAPQLIVSLEQIPMPRFWLEGSDGSTLMQIQKNAFLFNWRKREREYPQFEEAKMAFDENKNRFFKFLFDELREAEPKAQLAELTYINLIERCEYWDGLQDTPKVIPSFSLPVPSLGEREAPDFHQISSQRLAGDLTLNTTVRSARSAQDQSKPALVFEYRATGLLPDGETIDSWFNRAHAAIGDCFTKMTSRDIQETHWQRV